jgi:Tol biopolymer transport system component
MVKAKSVFDGRLYAITDNNTIGAEVWRYNLVPSIAGGQIIYTCGTTWQRHDICVMNPDGTNSHILVSITGLDHSAPRYSPDGTKILFSAGNNQGWYMYVADPDGSNPQRLASSADMGGGDWSPDGQRIAYACSGRLCIMDFVS